MLVNTPYTKTHPVHKELGEGEKDVKGFIYLLTLIIFKQFGLIKMSIYQRKTLVRQKLSIPEKTLERHIKILRDAGLIEYKGSKKTGGYYIVHDRDASNEGITEGINRGINERINEL